MWQHHYTNGCTQSLIYTSIWHQFLGSISWTQLAVCQNFCIVFWQALNYGWLMTNNANLSKTLQGFVHKDKPHKNASFCSTTEQFLWNQLQTDLSLSCYQCNTVFGIASRFKLSKARLNESYICADCGLFRQANYDAVATVL